MQKDRLEKFGKLVPKFMEFEAKKYSEIYNSYTERPIQLFGFNKMDDILYKVTLQDPIREVGWVDEVSYAHKCDTSWEYLMPIVSHIYDKHGYIITFFGHEGKIIHSDVYHAKVFGTKILKYFSASIYNRDLTSRQIVQELCLTFVEHLEDHEKQS